MKVWTLGRIVLAVCLLGVLGSASLADPGPSAPADALFSDAIAKVHPALVRIHVVGVGYGEGRAVKYESSGSGVIISPDGYVVTNHHVAARATRVRCTLPNREELPATLVGSDALADIAVLRLDLSHRGSREPLPVARWGDSSALRVGDPVLAMGSPMALSQSVTKGIVSNLEMTFPSFLWPQTFRLDGEETGALVHWIGHDAQIFPGNSGGPLVNVAGEIVGINEISFGLGGAIPAKVAREIAEELIRHGAIQRSWIGLELQPLLGGGGDRGALVSAVARGSPAEEAGVTPGDVLVSFAGVPVSVKYAEELPAFNRLALAVPAGTRVALVWLRGGREQRGTVVTVARGAVRGDEAEVKTWGMTARALTLLSAQELGHRPGSGVLVTSVRPGGPAMEAKPPLAPDDLIVAVDGRSTATLADLVRAAGQVAVGSPPARVVTFERRGQQLLSVLTARDGEDDHAAEARKAWLPIDSQVLTRELAQALGLAGKTGVRVTRVHPGAGAEAVGLRVGDVLLRVDGETVAASQPGDADVLPALIRRYPVGARVKLEGVRDGKPLAIEVELVTSPPVPREMPEYRDRSFDFTARDLGLRDRAESPFDRGQPGVLVTGVEAGGWAALAHLAVGDVILAVDGEPVASATALQARMRIVSARQQARVVLFVRRGARTLYLELEPTWPARDARTALGVTP